MDDRELAGKLESIETKVTIILELLNEVYPTEDIEEDGEIKQVEEKEIKK